MSENVIPNPFGYQPKEGVLDVNSPPKGGAGILPKTQMPQERLCPFCRKNIIQIAETVCHQCIDRQKSAKLDALAERAAIECLGHFSDEIQPEMAARKAWDFALAFRKEAVKRMTDPPPKEKPPEYGRSSEEA